MTYNLNININEFKINQEFNCNGDLSLDNDFNNNNYNNDNINYDDDTYEYQLISGKYNHKN